MNLFSPWIMALIGALAGIAAGYILRQFVAQFRKDSVELEVKKLLLDAKTDAAKNIDEAKLKAEGFLVEARREAKERESQIRKLEEKLLEKEDLVEKRRSDLDNEINLLKKKLRTSFLVQSRKNSSRTFSREYRKWNFLDRKNLRKKQKILSQPSSSA